MTLLLLYVAFILSTTNNDTTAENGGLSCRGTTPRIQINAAHLKQRPALYFFVVELLYMQVCFFLLLLFSGGWEELKL